MNISVVENKPIIPLSILQGEDVYVQQDFLIDTGFTGVCIFIVHTLESLEKYLIYDVSLLEKSEWVVLADGSKAKTFSARMVLQVNNQESEEVQILIMESLQDDIPILGMGFLEQNKKRFLLDFISRTFSLDNF